MKTQTSKRTIWSKGLLLLPLLAILLFSFSTTEVVERDASFSNSEYLESPHYKNSLIQDIATKKMVKEYNEIAKKYNSIPNSERKISEEELRRMVYIYDRMTSEQRNTSERFPQVVLPENAPPPPMPTKGKNPDVAPPAPSAPPAPQVEIEIFEMDGDSEVMPPPPPPVPSEHMQELADEGAEFYLEGKKITAEEAINLVKSKKLLTIDVRKMEDESTVVKITTEPIKKN